MKKNFYTLVFKFNFFIECANKLDFQNENNRLLCKDLKNVMKVPYNVMKHSFIVANS